MPVFKKVNSLLSLNENKKKINLFIQDREKKKKIEIIFKLNFCLFSID
jgi:hypothetical protein